MNAAEAVSYERISRFRRDVGGQSVTVSRGVDRQADDARAYAEGAGLTLVRHYTDNNRSASRFATKVREAWEDLLEDIRAGRIGTVLVWVLDRAVRQTSDLDELLEACRVTGTRLVQTATGTEVDPDNPESVLHAKISGAVAEYEAAKTAMRVRRQQETAAKAGRPHGGRRRFGYTETGEIKEDEAAVIRDAVSRVLSGATIHGLAAEYAAQGVTGTTGTPLYRPLLRQMLLRPYLAGHRVFRGEVIGPGDWEPIISPEDHAALVHHLSAPERRTSPASNVRRHLLSGLMRCDACEAKLVPASVKYGTAYRCPTGRHVMRPAEWVEAAVTMAVVERLRLLDPSGVFLADDNGEELARLRDARAAITARMDALVDELSAGDLSARAYTVASARMEADAESVDRAIRSLEAAHARPARVLAGVSGPVAETAWEELDLGRRRAVIAEVCKGIRLRGGRRRAPSDVVIDWR